MTVADVFESAHSDFMKGPRLDKRWFYVDTTNVRNKRGVDYLGRNVKDKSKKGNKLSTVCGNEGITYKWTLAPANVPDVLLVTDTLPEKSMSQSTLVGDKGYVSEPLRKSLQKKRKLKYVYPYRKNQKSAKLKNKKNARILKRRGIIERSYSWLKNVDKIEVRHERLARYYFARVSIVILNNNYGKVYGKTELLIT